MKTDNVPKSGQTGATRKTGWAAGLGIMLVFAAFLCLSACWEREERTAVLITFILLLVTGAELLVYACLHKKGAARSAQAQARETETETEQQLRPHDAGEKPVQAPAQPPQERPAQPETSDYKNCQHPLAAGEEYIWFDGKRYCPLCFAQFVRNEMTAEKLEAETLGVRSGLFRYNRNGTLWQINGSICPGTENAGMIVLYDVKKAGGKKKHAAEKPAEPTPKPSKEQNNGAPVKCKYVHPVFQSTSAKLVLEVGDNKPMVCWAHFGSEVFLRGESGDHWTPIPQTVVDTLTPESLLKWLEGIAPEVAACVPRGEFLKPKGLTDGWCRQIRIEYSRIEAFVPKFKGRLPAGMMLVARLRDRVVYNGPEYYIESLDLLIDAQHNCYTRYYVNRMALGTGTAPHSLEEDRLTKVLDLGDMSPQEKEDKIREHTRMLCDRSGDYIDEAARHYALNHPREEMTEVILFQCGPREPETITCMIFDWRTKGFHTAVYPLIKKQGFIVIADHPLEQSDKLSFDSFRSWAGKMAAENLGGWGTANVMKDMSDEELKQVFQ